jgi:hypothetical protein
MNRPLSTDIKDDAAFGVRTESLAGFTGGVCGKLEILATWILARVTAFDLGSG